MLAKTNAAFLNLYKVSKDDLVVEHTHTSMAGGCYHVELAAKYTSFLSSYVKALTLNEGLYLTERIPKRGGFCFFMDLDFDFVDDVATYTNDEWQECYRLCAARLQEVLKTHQANILAKQCQDEVFDGDHVVDMQVYYGGLRMLGSVKPPERDHDPGWVTTKSYTLLDKEFLPLPLGLDNIEASVACLKLASIFNLEGKELTHPTGLPAALSATVTRRPRHESTSAITPWIYEAYGHDSNVIKSVKTKTAGVGRYVLVELDERYCPFQQREHKGNRQYIILSKRAGSYQKCHDHESCDDLKHHPISFADLPSHVQNILLRLTESNDDDDTDAPRPVVAGQDFRKVNDALGISHDDWRDWNSTAVATGHQLWKEATQCILHPAVVHPVAVRACVLIKQDKSVHKICPDCGADVMSKSDAKKVHRAFSQDILHTPASLNSDGKKTPFQKFTHTVLEEASSQNLRRDRKTGDVYAPVEGLAFAFEKLCDAKTWVQNLFADNREFESDVSNVDKLVKYLQDFKNSAFPFLTTQRNYLGFTNGIYNTVTCEFTELAQVPEDFGVVGKYLPYEFTGMTETPLLDGVLNYQFKPEVHDIIYMLLGRMFGIRDHFGVMLYFLGESGVGKSLLIKVISACVANVGVIGGNLEQTFGLDALYETDLVTCDDLPRNISKVFSQDIFQSCITGGKVNVAAKQKRAIMVEWTTPLFFAGNWYPDYLDMGQISRRIVIANFSRPLQEDDPSLLTRILATELPAFVHKVTRAYNDFLLKHASHSLWTVLPQYFRDERDELRMDRDPLLRFLRERTVYMAGITTAMAIVRKEFAEFFGGPAPKKLNHSSFKAANPLYQITKVKLCKHCRKRHLAGCCDRYNRADSTSRDVVENMQFLDVNEEMSIGL
ncbi:hypothetical protein SmJEL517_g06196 [Synchytrium microbalum]|uniref:SF3 helicase domain-containing protein n=1 Tax=Synchytrium microbalum TaxID=1806994 RepID=A0A507BY29_9FUNG|nr:uncharacterized protein SmJEL517_g06196 [Synchytrium microbalum]TPX30183.1 hypothetical protein SmJEL517_g06196 [Synchytrium microbalum]